MFLKPSPPPRTPNAGGGRRGSIEDNTTQPSSTIGKSSSRASIMMPTFTATIFPADPTSNNKLRNLNGQSIIQSHSINLGDSVADEPQATSILFNKKPSTANPFLRKIIDTKMNTNNTNTPNGAVGSPTSPSSPGAGKGWNRLRHITSREIDDLADTLLNPESSTEFSNIQKILSAHKQKQKQKESRRGSRTGMTTTTAAESSSPSRLRRSDSSRKVMITENREMQRSDTLLTVQRMKKEKETHDLFYRAYYAAMGAHPGITLTLGRFKEYVKDASLYGPGVSAMTIEVMFHNLTKPHPTMSFEAFLFVHACLADILYPQEDPEDRISVMSKDKIKSYVAQHLRPQEDPLVQFIKAAHQQTKSTSVPAGASRTENRINDDEFDHMLYTYEGILSKLYTEFSVERPSNIEPADPKFYELGGNYNRCMTLHKFVEFMKTTELYPRVLTGPYITRVAKAAAASHFGQQHPSKKGIGNDDVTLLEIEFYETLVRLGDAHMRSHSDSLPTRVQMFFDAALTKSYSRVFASPMLRELDFSAIPLPTVGQIVPSRISVQNENTEVFLYGANFNAKRGVYVRLLDGKLELRCPKIESQQVSFFIPQMFAPDLSTCVVPSLSTTFFTKFDVSCVTDYTETTWVNVLKCRPSPMILSNDRGRTWTSSRGSVTDTVVFEHKMPSFALIVSQTNNLRKIQKDVIGSDSRFLSADHWNVIARGLELTSKPEAVELVFKSRAKIHYGGMEMTLDFDGFVSAIVHYGLLCNSIVHPSHFLDEILSDENMKKLQVLLKELRMMKRSMRGGGEGSNDDSENEEENEGVPVNSLQREVLLVTTRATRSLDVYCGPLLIGTLTDRPGYITLMESKSYRHDVVTYTERNQLMRDSINRHLTLAENFDQLVRRLRTMKLELAASTDSKTRLPIKRAWHINRGKRHLATLWQYPGNICTLDWIPIEQEAHNDVFTLMAYDLSIRSIEFLQLFMVFEKYTDPLKLRDAVELLGYEMALLLPIT